MAKHASSKSPAKLSRKWRDLLTLIPGYDPFAQAGNSWFDESAATLALEFFPECLKHVEGDMAGKPFVLEPWEQAIVANLFGWRRHDEFDRLVRRYREAFVFLPRKNGKTPLCAGLAVFITFCDAEHGQQNYIAAGEKDQAGLLFRQAKGMVEQETELNDRCRIYGGTAQAGQSRSIVIEEENSYLRVISADADTKHGGNTHLAIIDELHVQPNRDLVDVLQTSMASANRKQPLFINITTAGHSRHSICYEKYQYACKVRDNGGDESRPGYDPAFLPVIYETKAEEDWTSEEIWRKANPNLGVSVSLDYLRRECKKAQETPDYENTFRQLHLNQWTEQAVRWLQMRKWDCCGEASALAKSLAGRECYGGLDLASTTDLTALELLFPDDDGGYSLLSYFWVPDDAVKKRSRADGVRYDTWARQGLLRVTPGDWCDYNTVHADIVALAELFNIREIAFDPKEASMIAQKLQEAGITVFKFIQCFRDYNEPVKHFEQLIGEGKIRHGNHPVLRWMAENVTLDRNVAGLRMPSKAKSQEKIDGIVGAVMALGRAMLKPAQVEAGVEFI